MTAPFCYTSCVSAEAGESVALFASAPNSPCTLIIRRVGAKSVEVARFSNIEIYAHPTPENADTCGCGWPEAFRFTVEADWASGYYDLELIGSDGASSHHFIIVRPAKSAKRADAAIIVSTNTYFAYNYWGGANAYAHVESMMAGKPPPEGPGNGAIGRSRWRGGEEPAHVEQAGGVDEIPDRHQGH